MSTTTVTESAREVIERCAAAQVGDGYYDRCNGWFPVLVEDATLGKYLGGDLQNEFGARP